MLSILKGGLIMATGGAWISNLPPGYALAQMEPLGVADADLVHGGAHRARRVLDALQRAGRPSTPSAAMPRRRVSAGISRQRTVMQVFLIHGAFAGIASVLFATQLSVIQSTVPPNLELTIITASVVGGVSILGGIGSVVGSTLAAILLAAIGSSLIFLSVSPYWIKAVQGVLILVTVLADSVRGAAARWSADGAAAGTPVPRSRRAWLGQEAVLALILALALLIMALHHEQFFTVDNLLNQARLATEVGLVALPMTFIIITGGIDLSVGSTLGLCAIMLGVRGRISACRCRWRSPSRSLSALAGLVNGLIITRVGVPPLITTLATLALYRGLAEGISQARSVRGYPDWFFVLGQGDLAGIPTQLWFLVVLIILFGVALARTSFGRTLYAIGNNETASRFSGLPVDRAKLIIYGLSGLMSGLAAWIFVSRVSTTRSDMGTGLELDVIAAVVLGGTSIFGGTGSILGTVLGVALVQVLKNGLALTGVKGDATIVVIGAVLILSILIASSLRRRD